MDVLSGAGGVDFPDRCVFDPQLGHHLWGRFRDTEPMATRLMRCGYGRDAVAGRGCDVGYETLELSLDGQLLQRGGKRCVRFAMQPLDAEQERLGGKRIKAQDTVGKAVIVWHWILEQPLARHGVGQIVTNQAPGTLFQLCFGHRCGGAQVGEFCASGTAVQVAQLAYPRIEGRTIGRHIDAVGQQAVDAQVRQARDPCRLSVADPGAGDRIVQHFEQHAAAGDGVGCAGVWWRRVRCGRASEQQRRRAHSRRAHKGHSAWQGASPSLECNDV
jgi:hypothetical protein